MGFKTDSSHVDAWLSKMEVAIENIASLTIAGKFAVNQLMEFKAAAVVTAKAMFVEEPKWTMVIAKNVRQVINQAMKTVVDAPKQKERKFNLQLTSFEAKEGEIERELVQ
jgi:hypothetical protein